eukprot:g34870.t1
MLVEADHFCGLSQSCFYCPLMSRMYEGNATDRNGTCHCLSIAAVPRHRFSTHDVIPLTTLVSTSACELWKHDKGSFALCIFVAALCVVEDPVHRIGQDQGTIDLPE